MSVTAAIPNMSGPDVVVLNSCSIARKFLNEEVHLSYEEADHINLPCFGLYTLISIFPEETPIRYLVKSPYSGCLATPGLT
jgi:hypothetical protein